LTSNCPRLEAGFVGHNWIDSYVIGSQSQPVTVQSLRLASDFVAVATLQFYYFRYKKSSISYYKIKN
jgi:hypothetical protein